MLFILLHLYSYRTKSDEFLTCIPALSSHLSFLTSLNLYLGNGILA